MREAFSITTSCRAGCGELPLAGCWAWIWARRLRTIPVSRPAQETKIFRLRSENMDFKWALLIKPHYFDDERNYHDRCTQKGVVLAMFKVKLARKSGICLT